MKNIIAAIALLAATVPALAQTQLDPRSHEYRMWSAEQMIKRFAERLARTNIVCSQPGGEVCKAEVIKTYPVLKTIREVAAGGDMVEWAKIIDIVHEFEAQNEAALNSVERK